MDFKGVAEYFDKIEKLSSRLDMTDVLSELLEKTPSKDIRNLIYLAQGKLDAPYKQIEVGMGEKFVMEAIAKVSGFSRKEVESKFKSRGDLGTVAEEANEKKKQSSLFSEKLSLKKVHDNFLKISQVGGEGSQELKIKLLAELLNSSSPVEARFITRIVLANLRLGVGDPTIMDSLAQNLIPEYKKNHPKMVEEIEKELNAKKMKKDDFDSELYRKIKLKIREEIEAKYNIHSDLGEIAEMVKESGLQGLKKVKLTPGVPIRPTLAERLPTAEEIIGKIGKCAVEGKFDGFRLQVHKNKNTITIFSRNQENMTPMFPEIVNATREQIDADLAIVEGEALAVNEETNEFYPFQITMQRKRKYDIKEKSEEFPLKLFLFDVMLIEEENTMQIPFKERRKRLEKVLKKGSTINLTKYIETEDPKKIDQFFNESVSEGMEGIVCKDLNAIYIAGARKYAWIKLKRSYRGELQDSVDCVIIGYFKGKGKRTEFGVGGIITAVYNEERDVFESIAKIGTGFSEEQLQEFSKMLGKIALKHKHARVISEIEPDFWVEPKYVVEIRADEITLSPIHMAGKQENEGTGFALRFPRIIQMRVDKKPEEATSVKEIRKMFEKQKKVKLERTDAP